jgi:hypothetical protein
VQDIETLETFPIIRLRIVPRTLTLFDIFANIAQGVSGERRGKSRRSHYDREFRARAVVTTVAIVQYHKVEQMLKCNGQMKGANGPLTNLNALDGTLEGAFQINAFVWPGNVSLAGALEIDLIPILQSDEVCRFSLKRCR